MDCAVNATEIQQDDGTMRGIEIIPEGCRPVSEDMCTSGYMAPTENVSFPENSLKQCCKCKEGESCALCKNPDNCTNEEKDKFVTNENCFGTAVGSSPSPSVPAATVPKEKDMSNYVLIGGVAVVILILILIFLFSSRPKTP
jgi:hypothetical protein